MNRAVLFTLLMLCGLPANSDEQGTSPPATLPSQPLDITLADENLSYADYPPPPPFFKNLPGNVLNDLGIFIHRIDPKKNYKFLLGLTATTLVLVKYDQEILDGSKRIAENLGLISDTKSGREGRIVVDFSVGGLDLPVRAPENTNAALYFLGDGLTHVAIAGGLAIYGATHDDNRSVDTAGQIMEGILTTGIIVQVLKRTFGRESPYARTEDGGRWDFLPSFSDYSANVSHYDAFPSGHLATAMTTVTVLAANYPEKTYIKPVGYTLMALNAFAMLNNEVHWAADYPLALAIGWLSGDIAVERSKQRRQKYKEETKASPIGFQFETILPYAAGNDGAGVLAVFSF